MSSNAGPSLRSRYVDQSHHQTSYGRYTNQGQHASEQATINNINQYTSDQLREELRKHCSPSAAFDSAARFDPPRCAESTRLGIIQIIEEWIECDGDNPTIFWLYGGAGAGKSAIAQSLSENFQEKKQLAASFFFFRSDSARNNGDHLIPTLVSHLIRTFKGIDIFVEDRIRENWDLFSKKFQIQIQELLVEPLLTLKSKGALVTHPRLIVIDGLDECRNPKVQCELLRVIARAIPRIPYPLRFLVTSRPESHIADIFNRDLDSITAVKYNLGDDPDSDMDIRKFLEKEFMEIRRVHRIQRHLPPDWPGKKTITSLVERSSGHFIFASTVIRYIQSSKHRPDDRLEVILRLRPLQEGDRPYAQLDGLYAFIFEDVEPHGQLEKICLVLGILYLKSREVGFFSLPRFDGIDTGTIIEQLLEMKPGDLVLLLDPILSLIAIDGDKVRILHKSLFDYLLDVTRGGHLPFNLAGVHELVATYILKHKIVKDLYDTHLFEKFAYHCENACLNDTLKDYLHSLDVPFPKSAMTTLKTAVELQQGDLLNAQIGRTLWSFLRVLSREDFDSTGRVHKQFMAKWLRYLHSAGRETAISKSWLEHQFDKLPKWKIPNSEAVSLPLPQREVDNLKRTLDKLLRGWKPSNCNPMDRDVGLDPARRLAYVKQEHGVFSAHVSNYLRARSGNTSAIASSLVLGDYFIHCYNFSIQDETSFVEIRTYSRYTNTCHTEGYSMIDMMVIVKEIRNHLEGAESTFCPDLYPKYQL